jgi:hypothetical protein
MKMEPSVNRLLSDIGTTGSDIRKTMLLGCALVMLTGCALNHKIRYNLNDINPSGNASLKSVSLSVEPFSDERKNNAEDEILFTSGRLTSFQGKAVYVNSEKHYKNPSVSRQIAVAVANHMNKRAAFNSVMVSSRAAADFYLAGNLKEFYGMQGYSNGAAIGAQFGLIGALATLGIKTDATIRICFSDLKIYAKNGTLVRNLGEASDFCNELLPVDSSGWCIYRNVNTKLKNVVERLAEEVEKAVSDYLIAAGNK